MSAPKFTDRDALAELVNGGPLPKKSRTVGGIYERDTAYQRADAIIAAGWRLPGGPKDDLVPSMQPGCRFPASDDEVFS